MPNIHPVISSFPLAFFCLAAILEIVHRRSPVKALIVAGTTALVVTFISGYQAITLAGDLPTSIEELAGSHHTTGRLALIFGIVTLTLLFISERAKFNQKIFWTLYYLALTLTVLLCLLTGARGGTLIFEHGVGVTKASSSPVVSTNTPAPL